MVYGAMNRKDWRTVAVDDVAFERSELSNQLLPALRVGSVPEIDASIIGEALVGECRDALSVVLPLNEAELAFLDLLLDGGEIDARILTSDVNLQRRIQAQPWLEWKAQNVRTYRGLDRERHEEQPA